MCRRSRSWIARNWKQITAVAAVVGFFTSTYLQWHSLQETLETTRHAAKISLARSLFDELGKSKIYHDIERSIINREKLYIGREETRGGKYDWEELNSYFGFFEQIGYYYRVDAFDLDVIDVLFGGAIIEAYLDDDVRDYVTEMRTDGGQPTAFKEFQRVAEELIKLPSRESHVKKYAHDFTHW